MRRVKHTEMKSFFEVPDLVSIKLELDSGPFFFFFPNLLIRIHLCVYLTIPHWCFIKHL